MEKTIYCPKCRSTEPPLFAKKERRRYIYVCAECRATLYRPASEVGV